jgi:hypothetical protein
MSLWISEPNVSPPAWINSGEIWSIPGNLYFLAYFPYFEKIGGLWDRFVVYVSVYPLPNSWKPE